MIIVEDEFWVGCSSKNGLMIPQTCMKQNAFLEDVFIFLLVGAGGGAEQFLIYPAKGFKVFCSINIYILRIIR